MKMKKQILRSIKKGAIKSATDSANAKCPWLCYQPKAPTSLKKLKNKNGQFRKQNATAFIE